MKRSAKAPERSASAWRDAPRAGRPRAEQDLSAAGREAGTAERGAAGASEARIRRKRAMAWWKSPWEAASRTWCAHDGGKGAEATATAARGRGCMCSRERRSGGGELLGLGRRAVVPAPSASGCSDVCGAGVMVRSGFNGADTERVSSPPPTPGMQCFFFFLRRECNVGWGVLATRPVAGS